jgi:Mrp family chromosome partitioning ATPase
MAAALARRLAAAGTAVLVVDCNLPRPRVGDLLGTPYGADMPKYAPQDFVLKSSFAGLHVVPAGHASLLLPPDYWWELRLADLLRWARTVYGLILLDGPCANEPAARAIIARADMSAVCVSLRELESDEMAAVVSQIHAVKPAAIGVVTIDVGHGRKPVEAPPTKMAANQGW